MECPIKVNRHKGGRVDVYLCGSVGSSVPSGLGSNPVTSLNFSLSSFLLLVKLQLACDDQCFFFFYFTSATPKKLSFFTNTQLKLAQRREPLFWQYTVCKWLKCNKQIKISLSDLTKCPQSGRGRWECLFRAFIVWKKFRIDYLFSNDCLR